MPQSEPRGEPQSEPRAEPDTPPWWRQRALLAISVAVVLVVGIAAVVFASRDGDSATAVTASSTPSAARGITTTIPSVEREVDLDSLLLTPDQMSSATGIPDLQVDGRRNTTPYTKATDSANPPECMAVSHFMGHELVEGSGWTALRREKLDRPAAGSETAYQVVVEFPSDSLATDYVNRAAASWQACNRKPYTDSGGRTWEAEVTSVPGRTTSVTSYGSKSWKCESVVAVAREFIVETKTCQGTDSGGAARAADEIVSRITAL